MSAPATNPRGFTQPRPKKPEPEAARLPLERLREMAYDRGWSIEEEGDGRYALVHYVDGGGKVSLTTRATLAQLERTLSKARRAGI